MQSAREDMSDAFPLPCAQWADRLAAFHPKDLSETEWAELTAHIATCVACAAVLADYRRFAEQIRHIPGGTPQSTLPPRLRALWNKLPPGEEG